MGLPGPFAAALTPALASLCMAHSTAVLLLISCRYTARLNHIK